MMIINERNENMGLTFKKQDELEKLFDKFATVPKDKKKRLSKKDGKEKSK